MTIVPPTDYNTHELWPYVLGAVDYPNVLQIGWKIVSLKFTQNFQIFSSFGLWWKSSNLFNIPTRCVQPLIHTYIHAFKPSSCIPPSFCMGYRRIASQHQQTTVKHQMWCWSWSRCCSNSCRCPPPPSTTEPLLVGPVCPSVLLPPTTTVITSKQTAKPPKLASQQLLVKALWVGRECKEFCVGERDTRHWETPM